MKRGAKYTVKSRYGFWVVILESDSSGTIGGNIGLKNAKEWSFVATSDYILVRTDHITTLNYIHEAQLRIFEGDVDCGYDGYENYISPQYSTQSILLPQPLNKIGEIKDKFYWDEDKGHYCIEQNVSKELEVMASPNIIDLPHLNKKYSLDTYMPTTYLQCVDTTIQPSKLLLESDIVRYKPIFLDKNKEYQVKFDCKQKGNSIKLRLGGTEKTITPTLGENTVSITTPQEIVDSRLYLSGANNKVSNIYVIADNMSTGELQEDGTYKIDINTTDNINHYSISIITNNSLAKGNKLYWNKSNKRYEIDRSGEIEIPTVEGNVMGLPRLYQREDTNLTVESGNIKPSEVKIEYLDIN